MFESQPGRYDPFSSKPSSHEQVFQSLTGYGQEQQAAGTLEAFGERVQRAADFGRGVLGVIQRVDMVGSAQVGLGYADRAVGVAEGVLNNNGAVRFAERVPIVGGHVRAARGVTEMARTFVDTGNQLANSAGVLSQSPQARREVARSGLSAVQRSLESSVGIERGIDGRRKKVFRGLLKAAFNLFRTGGRSGVDALSEAGRAGALAAGASVFEQGQAYSPQTTPDNSPLVSSEPYEPFGSPKPYASYEEPSDPFANLSSKTDKVDSGGSFNRPEDIDIWGSVSTLGPGAIPPPPPPPSNRLQRTPGNPYGRW